VSSKTQGKEIGDSWLVVPAEELDLGRVYETNSFEHTFHITNQGDRPVTILGFEKTCDCLGITPEGGVILQPKEKKAFTINLALVAKSWETTNWDGELFQARFGAAYSIDGGVQSNTNWSWQLHGVVVPTISDCPIREGQAAER